MNQLADVTFTLDKSELTKSELQVISKLVEASRLMDQIFLRQVYRENPEIEAWLVRMED